MSASDKKKLRKELNAASFTERQLTEEKEMKKLKNYTVTFIVAMVLVVAIVLVSVLQMPVTNLIKDNTVAVTIGEHELDAREFDYFYYDNISEFYNQFSDSGDMADLYFQIYYGFNPYAPLDSQKLAGGKDGETWADFFIDAAVQDATWTYALYDCAVAEGHKLTEDEQKALDSIDATLSLYAALGGYNNVDAYVKAIYGSSATLKGYKAYCEVTQLARSYATKYFNSLEFTEDEIREHEKDKYNEYCSYSWYSHYIRVSDYLPELEKDENGKTREYTDEEKAAALAAAKADAEALVASGATTNVDLNKAINALAINKPEGDKKKDPIEAVENDTVLYSKISTTVTGIREWISSDEREAGDLTSIEYATGEDKDKEVQGYYVLLYTGRNDNLMSVGTVRHLLVKFEGGTKDKDTNKIVYSDAEKQKAKDEAEKLLKEFQEGEKVDEDTFVELVKKHTDDTGSKSIGGLIQQITPDSGYVDSFTEWATAEHEAGDVEIIESEYGYHIMYYVEAYKYNYHDMLITNEMVSDAYTEWEEDLVDAVTSKIGNMRFINRDLILSQAF